MIVTKCNLDYLSAVAYLTDRGIRPYSRVIGRRMCRAKATVDYHLDILQRAGLIEKTPFAWGASRVTDAGRAALQELVQKY